jgi:PAS domain S-box-containing protein
MMLSMLIFAWAASKFVPSKDALVKEIGQREEMERRLVESELKFRTLTEEAPVGISILFADGKLSYMNKAGLETLGATKDGVRGLGWIEYLHPDDKPEALQGILAHFSARKGFTIELRLKRPTGAVRWVHAQVAPVEAPGRPIEFISTFVDVTDAKEGTMALERKTTELEKTIGLMIGREKKMIELKEELEKRHGDGKA